MEKHIDLELKDFACIPPSLASWLGSSLAKDQMTISIRNLCHHMFLDTYGSGPADTKPVFDLYAPMLMANTHFRFRNGGLGSHKEAKISEYNKFGKAFCRWFLYVHCGMTYFAHMDQILNKRLVPGSHGYSIKRKNEDGDTPDYLCGNSAEACLAEAKGTQSSINFTTARFQEWRDQIANIEVTDAYGNLCGVKGYIVATRMVSDGDSQRVRSKLIAEDPWTDGKRSSSDSSTFRNQLISMVIAGHYASIMDKLRQPLLATALRSAIVLPEDVLINVGVWECLVPPLNRFKFVGGYFNLSDVASEFDHIFGWLFSTSSLHTFPQVNLSLGTATFFGLELGTFLAVREITRRGREAANIVNEVSIEDTIPDPLSFLRDGSVVAPLDYFRLIEVRPL